MKKKILSIWFQFILDNIDKISEQDFLIIDEYFIYSIKLKADR